MAQATPARSQSTARIYSVLAFVFGAVAIFLLPIIFGPAAIVMGYLGMSKGDVPLGRYAFAFAIVATIVGFVLGAVVVANN